MLSPLDKKAVLIITLASLVLLTAGLLTREPYIGDEVCHYKFTKDMFRLQRRIATEPDEIYDKAPYLHKRYVAGVLWQSVLGKIWRITGGVSESVAQIYHTIYFVILITCVYLLAKEKYAQDVGLNTLFVIASTPMVVLFGVIFYMDVPLLAFTALCFLMISKKRYVLAGVALGLMILTKINGLFFIPSFLLLIYCYSEGTRKTKLKNIFIFSSVALLINIPDMHFRYTRFGYIYFPLRTLVHPLSPVPMAYGIKATENGMKIAENSMEAVKTLYYPSSIFDPLDVLIYFGGVLLVLIVLYFILRKYERKDSFIWIGMASYIAAYLLYMYRNRCSGCDIRYLMPGVIPFLTVLAGKTLSSFRRKSFRNFLLLACCLQFAATAGFTYSHRKIPIGIREGYSFIQDNLPKDAILLYPAADIKNYAERLTVWGRLSPSLKILFWEADEKETLEILTSNRIDYISVKKSRIYGDSKVRHTGGYPKSFVEKLPTLPFLELIFDNSEMSIWKVDGSKETLETGEGAMNTDVQ